MSAGSLTADEIAAIHEQAPMVVESLAAEGAETATSLFRRLAHAPSSLAEWAEERSYGPGELVFGEGEAGDALYLVLSGRAAVATGRGAALRLIALRGPGEIVGEMALVENRPRMASLAAFAPLKLLRISRDGFHALLRTDQEFGLELMRILSGRLRVEARRQAAKPNGELRDPLTGVLSRAAFEDRLGEMAEQARRYGRPFSLCLVDLDHFKSVNDGYGHARGDEALREFARRAREAVRECDLIFRFGGDEFCLILPETGGERAAATARRLLEAVRERPFPGSPPLALTLSAGVAAYPEDAEMASDPSKALLEIADRRLYRAKREGRARVVGARRAEPAPAEEGERDVGRLIERDAALETLGRFFDELRGEGRAALRIAGPAGCGQTRFLREAAERAELLGYAVLWLPGRGEPGEGVRAAVDETLAAAGGGRAGALFALDAAGSADGAALDALRDAMSAPSAFPVGLAYAESAGPLAGFPGPLLEARLEPFGEGGVQLWLRHSLRWEAPPGFAARLRELTGGRPARLQREICRLVDEGTLSLSAEGWALRREARRETGE